MRPRSGHAPVAYVKGHHLSISVIADALNASNQTAYLGVGTEAALCRHHQPCCLDPATVRRFLFKAIFVAI